MGNSVKDRLAAVELGITNACQLAGRSRADVTLIAVSKGHPASAVAAVLDEGVRDFGESYVQEWLEKSQFIHNMNLTTDVRWHLIGHLQRNKAKHVAEGPVELFHALHSTKLATALNRRRTAEQGPLRSLIELNVDGERTKNGVLQDELLAVVDSVVASEHLRFAGLMCIPRRGASRAETRASFRSMRRALETCAMHTGRGLDELELSMGMSHDYVDAVAEGATMVRVGTAIFGQRRYS